MHCSARAPPLDEEPAAALQAPREPSNAQALTDCPDGDLEQPLMRLPFKAQAPAALGNAQALKVGRRIKTTTTILHGS